LEFNFGVVILFITRFLVKINGGIWKLKDKCNTTKNKYLKKFYINIYNNYLENKGSFIGYQSRFGNIPIFPHGILGIFISGDAKIGKNCVIFQHVTIGSNTLPDSKGKGSPEIGDNCYIGAGAKIIGNVKIGDNVRIGANCVVFQDIPSNSVVVSQPPRVIKKDKINNRFYSKNMNGEWVYQQNGKWIKEDDESILQMLN
jgi:serine O-acetyltransferase